MPVLMDERLRVGPSVATYEAAGGGAGLRAALAKPDEVIATIEAADLRGMGGAGFPTHRKWSMLAAHADCDKYVVCNGNEDEPGTFKDRFLLEHTPHQVIEGALVAAVGARANNVVLYVNPHQTRAVASVRAALEGWQEHPLVSSWRDLVGRPVSLTLCLSSGLYIGGEETAVIASVEGGFPFPRRKPPYPADQGVHGCPTLVNNVETLALASHVLANGADWYRGLGKGKAAGVKLFSLSGDVLRPGLYELPMGTTLAELVFEHGQGMLLGRGFKAVFTGGPSNTLLTWRDLDVPLDFDSVRARESRLGTGAMIVISEGTSIVRKVADYVDFFANGSCGQCPPCKGGTLQLSRLLNRIDTGRGVRGDLDALADLCRILPGSGRCGLIDGAVTVVQSSLRTFGDEYESQVAG